jgi:hypothetical protein
MLARYGFGLFSLPRYAEAKGQGWHLRHHLPSMSEGYLTQSFVEGNRCVLYQGRIPWMSTGLFEVESHAWHVHNAHGTVVAAGLGMGMYAYAVARRPEVTRLVVIERDPRVVEVLEAAAGLSSWPDRGKISILLADALDEDLAAKVAEQTGGAEIDSFYADIWPVTPDDTAPDQAKAMVERLKPKTAGWWGQEFNLGRWCLTNGRELDQAAMADYFAEMSMPVPMTEGYLLFCQDLLAANRRYLEPRPVKPASERGVWSRLFHWGRLFRRNHGG